MAVQKSKVSRRRRGNRRSHDALKTINSSSVVRCKRSGAQALSHHVTADGWYRGHPVLDDKLNKEKDTDDVA